MTESIMPLKKILFINTYCKKQLNKTWNEKTEDHYTKYIPYLSSTLLVVSTTVTEFANYQKRNGNIYKICLIK